MPTDLKSQSQRNDDGVQWLRFVTHSRIAEFEAKGWVVIDDLRGCNHGFWSVIMIWNGSGTPDNGNGL
jgi:hypothetical protein